MGKKAGMFFFQTLKDLKEKDLLKTITIPWRKAYRSRSDRKTAGTLFLSRWTNGVYWQTTERRKLAKPKHTKRKIRRIFEKHDKNA